MRERVAERDGTVVRLLVVFRRPHLVVELERLGFVARNRRRCDIGAAFGGRLFERREEDERLEDGPRLAARQHDAVVLRLVVGASADERENLARARIDTDERGLGLAFALAPRQQLVHLGQAVSHRVLRETLQVQVERGVDIDGLVGRRGQPRVQVVERLADVVHEVRRLGFERALHDGERFAGGARGLVGLGVACVDHGVQHDVAALAAPLRVVERRERRRRLDDAGDRRRFGERHVAHVLPEEEARRLADAHDGERAPLAERDVVQIHLEDLLLRCLEGQDDGHEHLEHLAARGALARGFERHPFEFREEHVAHQLLRNRAGAGHAGAAPRDVTRRPPRPSRWDRSPGARRTADPRSPARPGPSGAGSPPARPGGVSRARRG